VTISLIASYEVQSGGNNANTLTTSAFTPSNGEVIIVKGTTWDTGTTSGAPSGGSQTYTKRAEEAPGGFNCYAVVYTATVSGSPGSMSISTTPSQACEHVMVVERWSGAQLAVTPPTVTGTGNNTGVSANITTTALNSVISFCNADDGNNDPTSRAYLLSATEDGFFDGHIGNNTVQYHAYAAVTTATTYTVGMSAPAAQKWVLAGVAIEPSALNQTVTPTGIASGEAFGTATLTQTINAAGITSAEAFGISVVTGGAVVLSPGGLETQGELNRLAHTVGVGEQLAANIYAGTTGYEIVAALNIKAGNTGPLTWKDLQGVCNQLAGTSGLGVAEALSKIPTP
jgi:hypothetical protein